MQNVLEKLKQGILKFQRDIYATRKAEYEVAATTPQKPHTLLITCADSRIDPEMITQSGPGEIFVTRNVGNMVPAYGEMVGGVSAVIEYAVDALGVQHVAIMGHSDCGAMKGLLSPEALHQMPTVETWLRNGTAALRVAESLDTRRGKDLLPTVTEQNVLLQLQHLKTHPSVAAGIARNALTVSGWIYDIGHGEVSVFNEETHSFEPVKG